MDEPYDVDDRGNVAQFYWMASGDIVATIDRESGPNANESTWDGNAEVTAWAISHGYPEVATMARIG